MSISWQDLAQLEKEGKLPDEASPLFFECERILNISDIHFPFHDPERIENLYNLIQSIQFDRLIINGDALDFKDLSKFINRTKTPVGLERKCWLDFITIIRSMFTGHIDFIPGNHERRLEVYMQTSAPALDSLEFLELPGFLSFKEYDITLHDYNGLMLTPDFMVYHGEVVRKYPGWSARGEFEKFGINGVSGHTHRAGTWTHSDMNGTRTWTEQGCLCSTKPEYITGTPNWQQGCAVHYKYGEKIVTQTLPVVEGKLLFEGNLY